MTPLQGGRSPAAREGAIRCLGREGRVGGRAGRGAEEAEAEAEAEAKAEARVLRACGKHHMAVFPFLPQGTGEARAMTRTATRTVTRKQKRTSPLNSGFKH